MPLCCFSGKRCYRNCHSGKRLYVNWCSTNFSGTKGRNGAKNLALLRTPYYTFTNYCQCVQKYDLAWYWLLLEILLSTTSSATTSKWPSRRLFWKQQDTIRNGDRIMWGKFAGLSLPWDSLVTGIIIFLLFRLFPHSKKGSTHSSIVFSAPTILRPCVRIRSTSYFFNFNYWNCIEKKNEKTKMWPGLAHF